jgi:hypothetical protein
MLVAVNGFDVFPAAENIFSEAHVWECCPVKGTNRNRVSNMD